MSNPPVTDTVAIVTKGNAGLSADDEAILAKAPLPGLRQRIVKSRWLTIVSTPLLILVFLLAWKMYTQVSGVSRFVLPPPEAVGLAFFNQIIDPYVWTQHIWTTFYEVMAGLFWAIIVGVGLGFAIGKWPIFERITRPFIVAT